MKTKSKMIISTIVAAVLALGTFSGCTVLEPPEGFQELDYTESLEKIDNPDQGFYRPISVRMTDDGASYNKNIVNDSTQLYHLRIDISAFSAAVNGAADKQISSAALDGLRELLMFLKSRDKNAVVRFAYDPYYNGAKDKEPDMQMILKHIEQVCAVMDGYENTITAIEVGLIGPWGEMHSSAIANAEHITPITDAFLTQTAGIPVLVRTPKMIYDYLGITADQAASYTVPESSKAYRLGLFNDGYLGSDNDLGTYTDRARDIKFLSGQTEHLPFGGEVVIPDSKLHDINTCTPEMFDINLSYLNIEWNNQVIDKWKNSTYTKDCGSDNNYYGETAFRYIENHMGYRFVLRQSQLLYGDGLTVGLELDNVGFGNLNRTKHAEIVIADEDGEIEYRQTVEDFSGDSFVRYSVSPNLDGGKYEVYLRIYGEEADGTYLYCLRFANNGLWNADLKANKIGGLEIGE